ncbi:MAG: 4-hydroxythreonine-4-phosphate dehydrogenase PdxA [Candidatus Riflebacteria bacterium]|nr:4-hydroxythreonine-4-phosphate dehydrogenase PdxA [Candidatus Riflebacteria bacterium]
MKSRPSPPDFALTLGDPSGIGPEITATLLATAPRSVRRRLIIVGSRNVIEDSFRRLDKPLPRILHAFDDNGDGVRFLDTGEKGPFKPGSITAQAGASALSAIFAAHRLCMEGRCAGIVTAPIGKKAISLAGSPFAGHTDLLCSLTNASATRMAMVHRDFRVVMTTLHVAWRDVPKLLTEEAVYETLRLTHETFATSKHAMPEIAVAGLNPHAGEDGLFGNEEEIAILPAIKRFHAVNPNVYGPFPADSLFKKETRRRYSVIVAQTHDQGLIAIKSEGGIHCVNVTLGLPYIRTSVGHGTAYDIAGQGKADPRGLKAAIREAFRLGSINSAYE